jgi:hypothetical protein
MPIKSPEQPCRIQKMLDIATAFMDFENNTKSMSTFSIFKPKYESICNVIGSNPELRRRAFHDTFGNFYSFAMEAQRIKDPTTVNGMQSLPQTDKTKKSKQIESCPTGNTGTGKGKNQSARKKPA